MSRTLSRLSLAVAALLTTLPLYAADTLPVVQEELVAPPQVPAPITRKTPARVVVNLTVEEVEKEISPGTSYTFWTFGGTVPGKMIRVREGDTVELHLHNLASSKLPHNIDLHAVSGPGGGAPETLVAPGNEARFTFKALRSGLYVYHCATTPVGMHVGNGMYGMILVEPPEGMAPVDHEYYVMQGDFYTVGAYRAGGLQAFDMQKAIDEKPTYVLFNGADKALTGKNALSAKVGEKVRILFGDGGPNMTSSFHIIGTIFDKVYTEGGKHFQENVQTTMVPAGGSAIVEFTTQVPGNLTLVDHSLTRAFNKGAIGILAVSGEAQPEIYSKGVITVTPGQETPKPTAVALQPGGIHANAEPPADFEAGGNVGRQVFERTCAACHQSNGGGIPGVFPPLHNSDYFKAHPTQAALIVMGGRAGEITVNGSSYNSVMPPQDLSDSDVAAVLNFVSTELNGGKPVIATGAVHKLRGTPAP
jgi:nitrite reductase (NO-forming)